MSNDHGTQHSPEEIRKHVRTYMFVFGALLFFTIVTVAINQFHLSVRVGITIALIIACIKGSLVGGFFMHLFSEKKLIFWIILLTFTLFIGLMLLPIAAHVNGWTLVLILSVLLITTSLALLQYTRKW